MANVASQKDQRGPENKKDTSKWKEGQATKEEYREVVKNCRHGVRMGKAENELRLTRDVKNIKNGHSSGLCIEKDKYLVQALSLVHFLD